MSKYRNGFTLIELIITIALISIVIAAAFSMLIFGNKVFAKSMSEMEMQSNMRLAIENVNKTVRYASAVFTVPSLDGSLTDGWSYFGVHTAAGSNEVVEFIWTPDGLGGGTHVRNVIMPARSDSKYGIYFDKTGYYEDESNPGANIDLNKMRLVSMRIDVIPNGSASASYSIDTKLIADNSLQVIDEWGGSSVAIAYRIDDRAPLGDGVIPVVGQVSMVLDKSGSMSESMTDTINGHTVNSTKMKILQRVANQMVGELARHSNVDVSLVPFSDTANSPNGFLNAALNTTAIQNDITNMRPSGATNTGDGLRRAKQQLVGHKTALISANPQVVVKNYVIVLVDGETTYYSVTNQSANNIRDSRDYKRRGDVRADLVDYYTGDGNITDDQTFGYGSSLDPLGTEYVDDMVDEIKTLDFLSVYVVGFASDAEALQSVLDMANRFGVTPRYATSTVELENVFDNIQQEISTDIWYLQGPGY